MAFSNMIWSKIQMGSFTRKFIVCVFLFILLINYCYANDVKKNAANIGFHLLEEPINPKFIGMGSVGTALAGSGFSFYNPALPFLVGKSFLSVEFGQYPKADFKRAHFEGNLYITNWFFGLSFHTESIDNIYPVNFWGNLPGYHSPFSQQLTNISLNVGFSQWEDFAFAFSINSTQDRIYDESAYAFSLNGGLVYIPIPTHLTLGLSFLNLGKSTPMLGSDTEKSFGKGEKLPLNSRMGVTWQDTLKTIPYKVALDIVYRNVRNEKKSFKSRIQDRFTVPFGLEIRPLKPLAIRLGKRFNLDTEVLNFGFGLNLDFLAVDASFVITRLIDDAQIKWLTGISYYMKKRQPSSPPAKTEKSSITPSADSSLAPIESSSVPTKVDTMQQDGDGEITDTITEKMDTLPSAVPLDTIQKKVDTVSSDESPDTTIEKLDTLSSDGSLDTTTEKVDIPEIETKDSSESILHESDSLRMDTLELNLIPDKNKQQANNHNKSLTRIIIAKYITETDSQIKKSSSHTETAFLLSGNVNIDPVIYGCKSRYHSTDEKIRFRK